RPVDREGLRDLLTEVALHLDRTDDLLADGVDDDRSVLELVAVEREADVLPWLQHRPVVAADHADERRLGTRRGHPEDHGACVEMLPLPSADVRHDAGVRRTDEARSRDGSGLIAARAERCERLLRARVPRIPEELRQVEAELGARAMQLRLLVL